MSGRVGVELTPSVVRVVQLAPLSGRVVQSFEIPWSPEQPDELVAVLRARLGRPSGIALAIGLGFLNVMRVEFPPVPPDERARIVELEPERYFAAAGREPLATSVAPDAPIAFASPRERVARWIAAFERWAPVDIVEPSPVAVARVLAGRDGAWKIDASPGETGVLHIDRGRMVTVRRVTDATPVDARDLRITDGVSGAFAAALGVARQGLHHASAALALAPDAWRRRLTMRRRMSVAAHAVVTGLSLIIAFWAADRWRDRTLDALDERSNELRIAAAPADTALLILRSREAEAETLRNVVATRPDVLGALAAISATLPRDANVLSARASGNDWQIDGTAGDASRLVPLLDAHARFDSVRFLSASSRYRDGTRSYETFSIALRYRP